MNWSSIVNDSGVYSNNIPNSEIFSAQRGKWRGDLAKSRHLRDQAIQLTIASDEFKYGYQWEWCGVPIIRHPDDIVLQQEIMWSLKPSKVIETGIARGGSVVLSHSLLGMVGGTGEVLGLDIQILPHTFSALEPWSSSGKIVLQECDTSTEAAAKIVTDFIGSDLSPMLMILDSNHTHDHVLAELVTLAPLLPSGSVVMVADTIIEEMPEDYYPDRPWGGGNNPLTAVNRFLEVNKAFSRNEDWSRRSLMGEFRDGILLKHGA
jgi:cephalosporin hydroxylase